ncbi:MAG: sulfotransferase domain-containing protein [Psychroflexus sp.]
MPKLQFEISKQVLLFSDPRGGSTWLAEMLCKATHKPMIFEPLHLKNAPQVAGIGFGWRQYIPEDAEWLEAEVFFQNLFSGKIMNWWLAQMSQRNVLVKTDSAVFKFCRGSMLLPYLVKNFKFDLLPIYMVRHPFGVVASQLKHGSWSHVEKIFRLPDAPHNEVFKIHQKYLESLTSKAELLTAYWCITNAVVLNHPENNRKWITIYYENLVTSPEKVLNKIFQRWNIKPDFDKLDVEKPSKTALNLTKISPKAQISSWQNFFSESEINKMLAVLNYFKISAYGKDIYPKM